MYQHPSCVARASNIDPKDSTANDSVGWRRFYHGKGNKGISHKFRLHCYADTDKLLAGE